MPADPGAARHGTGRAGRHADRPAPHRGGVRVTCELCGHVTLHDRETLIQYRRASGSELR